MFSTSIARLLNASHVQPINYALVVKLAFILQFRMMRASNQACDQWYIY